MARTIILGGTGFFGSLIAERIPDAIVVSRSRGVDANNPAQLRANMQRGDVVIDAAGPYQTRTSALLDAAIEIGFDVIDLSDSPEYSSKFLAREAEIRKAGIRTFTACSALSAVSAIALETVTNPKRLSVYLLPASRYTANRGTIASVAMSIIGKPRTLHFPEPLGKRSGVTVKSVDSVMLPHVQSEFIVDSGIPGMNPLFPIAARFASLALPFARRFGRTKGVLAYEVTGAQTHHVMFLGKKSYLLAIVPAVLAARSTVNRDELLAAIRKEGDIDVIGL
jgi:hypothetical protein